MPSLSEQKSTKSSIIYSFTHSLSYPTVRQAIFCNMKSVVLGFSGGIDSQSAARCLRDEGWRVVALTIDTLGDEAMISRAQRSAEALGIEWMSYDARQRFESDIINYFCQEYIAGRTPAPCTRCNTHIKWSILSEVADSLNIHNIATGHYFRIEQHDNRCSPRRRPRKRPILLSLGTISRYFAPCYNPYGRENQERCEAKF